jgi:hypothetical protein
VSDARARCFLGATGSDWERLGAQWDGMGWMDGGSELRAPAPAVLDAFLLVGGPANGARVPVGNTADTKRRDWTRFRPSTGVYA